MSKGDLERLKLQVEKDKSLPLREGATNLVFGEGNPNARVIFLGEAPGRQEDEQGRPFVGRSGQFLTKLLESIGVDRKDVWISSVVYFRPPENRLPTPSEIKAYSDYVDQQIKIISPKVIVTLGRTSLSKFLPTAKITQVHGQPQQIEIDGRNLTLLPMFHPAAGLRAANVKKQLEEDFNLNHQLLSQ